MDTSAAPLLNYGLRYQWCSDSDLSGVSSPETLSPVHSADSGLSPSFQRRPLSDPKAAEMEFSQSLESSPCSRPGRGRRMSRAARVRSKQRESASEKEKLRMRDLTKALHHLRSYLPPSVAPAGQTLTKIETLRLTIGYISHLSAQLGLSEEVLFQRRERGDSDASSPDILSYLQRGAAASREAQPPSQGSYSTQCHSQSAVLHSGSGGFGVGPYMEAPQRDWSSGSMLQSPPVTQPSCQMCGKDVCMPLVPREYWG